MKDPRMFICACTGGTYGPLHEGHKKLFSYAFNLSDSVVVRLTTDRYIGEFSRKQFRELIQPYDERFGKLYEHLDQFYGGRFEILPLDGKEDCTSCKFRDLSEVMIVGQDSLAKAYKLNLRRRESGLYEVYIIGVPAELSDDRERISSTRIRAKEIDRKGKLLAQNAVKSS